MSARNRLSMVSSHLEERNESELLPEFPMLLRHERKLYDGKFHSVMSGTRNINQQINSSDEVKNRIPKYNHFATGFIQHWQKSKSNEQLQTELYNSCLKRLQQLYGAGNENDVTSDSDSLSIVINKKSKWENLKSGLDKDLEEIRILYVKSHEEENNHSELNHIFKKPTIIKTILDTDFEAVMSHNEDDLSFDIIIIDSSRQEALNLTNFIFQNIPNSKIWLNLLDTIDKIEVSELKADYLFSSVAELSITVSKKKNQDAIEIHEDDDQPSVEQLQTLIQQLAIVSDK